MKHFFSLRPWILAAVVLASAGTTVAAQGKMEAYPANEKWFVSGSVGAGVYVGDYDMHAKFGNRISVTGDVSGGKWITPVLGARLQISGMHASGEAKNGSSESWNFMMYHADIMVDVLRCGRGTYIQPHSAGGRRCGQRPRTEYHHRSAYRRCAEPL